MSLANDLFEEEIHSYKPVGNFETGYDLLSSKLHTDLSIWKLAGGDIDKYKHYANDIKYTDLAMAFTLSAADAFGVKEVKD